MKLNQKTLALFLATVAVSTTKTSNAYLFRSGAANVKVDKSLMDSVAFTSADDLMRKPKNNKDEFSKPSENTDNSDKVTMAETTKPDESSSIVASETTTKSGKDVEEKIVAQTNDNDNNNEEIISKSANNVEGEEPTLLAKDKVVTSENSGDSTTSNVAGETTTSDNNNIPTELEGGPPVIEKSSESTLVAEDSSLNNIENTAPESTLEGTSLEENNLADTKPIEETSSSTIVAEKAELDDAVQDKVTEKVSSSSSSDSIADDPTSSNIPSVEQEPTNLVVEDSTPIAKVAEQTTSNSLVEDSINEKLVTENTPVSQDSITSATEGFKKFVAEANPEEHFTSTATTTTATIAQEQPVSSIIAESTTSEPQTLSFLDHSATTTSEFATTSMDSLSSSADIGTTTTTVTEPLAFVAKHATIELPDFDVDTISEVTTAVDGAFDGVAHTVLEGATGTFVGLVQTIAFIL